MVRILFCGVENGENSYSSLVAEGNEGRAREGIVMVSQ